MPESSRVVGRSVTRRGLLRIGAAGAAGLVTDRLRSRRLLAATESQGKAPAVRPQMRPDLLDERSPKGLEIIQITSESDVPSSHVYMEAQIFTPDSKRFVLHRSAHAHGSDRNDPRHRFLRCDIDDGFSLHPLTEEMGTTAPSVSPDGKYLYYFVDQTKPGRGRFRLMRVNLDGTDRQTLMVVDHPIPGTNFRASRLYLLSTISSDGKRLAISAFLGDGGTPGSPFGLMVFDLEGPSVRMVLHGPTWRNMHPQYCRSADAEASRDLLVQENHGGETDAMGQTSRLVGGEGADIHVIRDDGTNFRDMPWGRDGQEFCQGHQCWRGRTPWAITSTLMPVPNEQRIIESLPVAHANHIGLNSPGGTRNELSREFASPHFYHFATDIDGRRLISDADPFGPEARIYMASLGEPGKAPLTDFVCLARPRCSGQKTAHLHPFLSPDGRTAFFNSDDSGVLQAYAVRGFAG